ncbi:unnamed protein product [Calicophoron daubneyi]|uniref:WD repeat-containing protein 7 n=1 Tax=Calicophoron daubneyi TaxID=300641 RepID=A0AAV2TC61_CALDB
MIRISGNVTIPFVVWAPTPPIHDISCILISQDCKFFVTGATDGNLILWAVSPKLEFMPKWMVLGHRSCVKNLCLAGGSREDGANFFFSHSESNEMALWSWEDGKSLEFKIDTRHQHTTIKSHQPAFLEYRLLFCCGRYPHIVVLHAMSLSVLFTLASQSQPDWISSFVVFTHPNQRHEIVLGLSFSNVATLWTLSGEEIQGETKYEHESRAVDCLSTVTQVHCFPKTPRCVLLVTYCGWQLLDAMTCSIICSQHNPVNDPLVGGEFIDSHLIVIYRHSGVALLYRLPEGFLSGGQAPSSHPSHGADPPLLIARLSPTTSPVNIFTDETSGMDRSSSPPVNETASTREKNSCCFTMGRLASSVPLLMAGSSTGEVISWVLKDYMGDGEVQNHDDLPQTKCPSSIADLAAVWKKFPPRNLLDNLSDSSEPKSLGSTDAFEVTEEQKEPCITVCVQILQMNCSHFQGAADTIHPPRLAVGLSTGRIVILRLTDFLQSLIWKSSPLQPSDVPNAKNLLRFSRYFLDGHTGPVTSLLHPASAEEHLLRSLDSNGGHEACQFSPDHLISGGADCTVRMWDLNPWRDNVGSGTRSGADRIDSNPAFSTPTCLAVFRCHASPCVGLAIGPPSMAISNASSGNPRLGGCILSVGTGGCVSIISLREQRQLIFTGSAHSVSSSPVVAVGWRVPEDLLLIAHGDGCLEVWDITAGCLDRLETDQSARDLFDQAHYIVEVQNCPCSFGASLPLLSHLSIPGAENTRLRGPALPFSGAVNSATSAGAVLYTAQARLRRGSYGFRSQAYRSRWMTAIQLHPTGATKLLASQHDTGEHGNIPESPFSCGPAALVFHWDTEAFIVDLLAQCGYVNPSEKDIADWKNIASCCPSQAFLIQLAMSVLHPWGVDPDADTALQQCAGFVLPDSQPDCTSNSHIIGDGSVEIGIPELSPTLCLGLVSKHGCLSISMPGWPVLHSVRCDRTIPLSRPLFSMTRSIGTNLLLAELSLAETLTYIDPGYLGALMEPVLRRFQRIDKALEDSTSVSTGTKCASVRSDWLQLAARLCGPLLKKLSESNIGINGFGLDLEMLAEKWQDRTIPIRYAARTLMIAYLDQLGSENRQLIVDQWSALLPPFSRNELSKSSKPPHGAGVANGNVATHSPSVPLSQSGSGSPNNSSDDSAAVRRQSLQQHQPPIQKYKIGSWASAAASFDNDSSSLRSMSPEHSVSYVSLQRQQTGSAGGDLPAANESVSLSSLDLSNGGVLSIVSDSRWWLTLGGYRISAREHARLQAIAVVILGVVGSRYGANVKLRHPAVVVRDLIDEYGPVYPQPHTDRDSMCRRHGLGMPFFGSPDADVDLVVSVSDVHLPFIDQLAEQPLISANVVQHGFGYDSYHLAHATCQCLTALLFNRTPLLTSSSSSELPQDGILRQTEGVTGLPAYSSTNNSQAVSAVCTANALICLLTKSVASSLRRAAIDLLGRGFIVWEPYVDLAQVVNALLTLVAGADSLISSVPVWQPLTDRVDLARTAREALWAIAFARPKAFTLVLSVEVRRCGAQLSAAAAANTISHNPHSDTALNTINQTAPTASSLGDASGLQSVPRGDSAASHTSQNVPPNPRMTVMMASPAMAAPVFAPPSTPGSKVSAAYNSTPGAGPWPPMYNAREEIVRLFEQLCVRRPADVIAVLPEILEVVLACLDRTRLKERGLDFVFPALRQFSTFSSHTRLQKACVGGVNGSLTFFDFKIGRYSVIQAHKGPVTAVRFHSDGRLLATYSLSESVLRTWQLCTAGLFGMGGQQVKAVSSHPVPPLLPPPKHGSNDTTNSDTSASTHSSEKVPTVWLDWPETKVVHLITDSGVKRRVNL